MIVEKRQTTGRTNFCYRKITCHYFLERIVSIIIRQKSIQPKTNKEDVTVAKN
jgi:hypothetical protein